MGGLLGNIQPGGAGGAGSFKALGTTGTALAGMGLPQLQQAGGYFSKLAGGNRATMTQALAPDIENVNSVYGGTARTLSRFLRGPQRDTQLAETERERAGQIGSLFRGARPQANMALAGMGSGNVSTAGGLFGGQAQLGQSADIASSQLSGEAGRGFGGLLFNLFRSFLPGAK